MLVLFCILAGPEVPASINGVYCAGCTALSSIVYLVLSSNKEIKRSLRLIDRSNINSVLRSEVQSTSVNR